MAMAERPFSILKVIVAAQFFSSCYFKVQLLHNVTLKLFKQYSIELRILLVGYFLCLDEHGLTHQYESLTLGRAD